MPCSEEGTLLADQGTVLKDAVMIGSIPCKLPSEVHVNRQRVSKAKDKGIERQMEATNVERWPKHSRLIYVEGCEIVGPCYSMPAFMHRLEPGWQRKAFWGPAPEDHISNRKLMDAPQWCPRGLSKTQRLRLQEMR
jgi:hypothetical protein